MGGFIDPISPPRTRLKYHRRKLARQEAARRMWINPEMHEMYMTLTHKSRRWWKYHAFP